MSLCPLLDTPLLYGTYSHRYDGRGCGLHAPLHGAGFPATGPRGKGGKFVREIDSERVRCQTNE